MQMIDVLKRLAELDAKNPNIVKTNETVKFGDYKSGVGTDRPADQAGRNALAKDLKFNRDFHRQHIKDPTNPYRKGAASGAVNGVTPVNDPRTTHPGQLEGSSEDDDLVGMVQSTIEDILSGAQQGQDMTDNIADELGDHFDAVQNSGDENLQQAYSMVRDAADTSPEEQAQAARAALEMLSGDRGMDEGWKEKLGALGTAAAIGLGSMGAAQPAQAAPATPTTASAQQQQAVYQGAYRMAAKFAQTNKNFAQEFKKLSDDHKEHVSRIEGSSFMNPSLKKQNDQKMQKLDSQFKMDIQNLLKVYGATNEELAESLEECGMMGGMSPQPHTPATINMTADNGEELTGMLKDIMSLAGLRQVDPADLGHEHEPTVMTGEPGVSVANPDSGPMDMKGIIAKIDSMNSPADDEEEKTDETMSNTPMQEPVPVPPGTQDPAGHPGVGDRMDGDRPKAFADVTYESLMAEYRKFISE